jgi:hypothetical protein
MKIIRQGDVLLVPVPVPNGKPAGATPVPLDKGRIVLAYGEVTGHAHAIAIDPEAVVNTAVRKAQLHALSNGTRLLEVREPVTLTHEEHTAHTIPPGWYEVPVQVDMTIDRLPRRVGD